MRENCGAVVLVPLDLEQSVDGLGGSARDLAHALCGASRRCGKRDFEPVILKQLEDSVQGRCFSRSGAAGQDKQSALDGGDYRLSLKIAVFYAVLFLYSVNLPGPPLFCLREGIGVSVSCAPPRTFPPCRYAAEIRTHGYR